MDRDMDEINDLFAKKDYGYDYRHMDRILDLFIQKDYAYAGIVIDDEHKRYLKKRFQFLTDEVDIKVYYDIDDELAFHIGFTKKFASEIAGINNKIKLSFFKHRGIGSQTKLGMTLRTNPSITIGEDKGYRILYSGLPVGRLVVKNIADTIIMVSKGNHGFDENIVKELKSISKDVHVKVFITQNCLVCMDSVYLANRVAVASGGKVLSETILVDEDFDLNLDLAHRLDVETFPTQIISNDEKSITVDFQEENELVNLVLSYGK